jgi:anti-sigma factor RsiW
MTHCLEFRRRIGAEPFAADAALEAHRAGCPACARYQDELRAMDGVIRRALAVDSSSGARARMPARDDTRRRLLAIAASLVAGAAIGVVLLVSAPRASVAREVFDHVMHEPGTMHTTEPLAPAALAAVLDPDGTRLKPDVGDVTFAARCEFDGHVVPHLVVRTAQGPVTVLMLRHRTIREAMRIDEQGYQGVVMPAPRGSIAIVGQGIANLEGVAQQVYDAVDWGR